MADVTGVDVAWTIPAPGDLVSHGYRFSLRYLSHDRSKSLTRQEAEADTAAGLLVGVVFEDGATRALDGYAAGVADAQFAQDQAASDGMPAGRPIYFAVDSDVNPQAVFDYFRGVCSILGQNGTGVYGNDRVCDGVVAAGFAAWRWQTAAWSGGRLDPGANLYQRVQQDFAGTADVDVALTPDFGGWRVGGAGAPAVPPFFGGNMDPALFVRWCYESVLLREPESAEKQTEWEQFCAAHGPDLTYAAFLDSDEGRAVTAAKRKLLGLP